MNSANYKIDRKRVLNFILVLIPIFISLYLFNFILNYYFFQDDWFNFNIANINTFKEYLGFFKFRDDIIAYRPLEIQTQYFLFRNLFGLNAVTFRVINFSLLFISYILILYLARYILNNSKAAFFAAALWVTSSFHFMNLGMINYHLWGTMFWLINFLLIIRFAKTKKIAFYLLSVILYVISLGLWEFAISLPIIVTAYFIYVTRFKIIDVFKIFLPFYLISIIYLVIRHFFVAHLPLVEYQIAFNLNSLKALFWYITWAFNVPEEFKKQIADNLIIFKSEFLRDYWQLIYVTILGSIFLIALGLIYPFYKSLKNRAYNNFKLLIFLTFWFGVAIFPALLLPNRNFMMYLTLPSISLYLSISHLIFNSREKSLPVIFFVIWIFLTFATVRFYKVNFFVVEANNFSRQFAQGITKQYPTLPSNSVIYYNLPYKKHQQALFDQNAIQTLYGDQTINVFYTHDSLVKYLKNANEKRPVYVYLDQ